MSDNPFKSNLPEGFETGEKFHPTLTDAQKKHLSEVSTKLNAERLSDPEYYDRIANISREIAKRPERNKKLSETQREYWNSESGKQQRSELQKKNWEMHRETMQQALADRYKDGTLSKKISNALKESDIVKEKAAKRVNKIQTPDGVFNSRKEAAEFYRVHPTTINTKLKNHPDKFYYIEIGNGATGYKDKK